MEVAIKASIKKNAHGVEYVEGSITIGDETNPLQDFSRSDDGTNTLYLYYVEHIPAKIKAIIKIDESGNTATIQTFVEILYVCDISLLSIFIFYHIQISIVNKQINFYAHKSGTA